MDCTAEQHIEDPFLTAFLRFDSIRVRLERRVVAFILADPRRGHALAVEARVTPEWFDDDAHRLIFCAVEVLEEAGRLKSRARGMTFAEMRSAPRAVVVAELAERDAGRRAVYRLARRALIDDGLWNPLVPAGSDGPVWSDAALRSLFDSYPGAGFVPQFARDLEDHRARSRDVAEHTRYARKLLAEEMEVRA